MKTRLIGNKGKTVKVADFLVQRNNINLTRKRFQQMHCTLNEPDSLLNHESTQSTAKTIYFFSLCFI